MIAVILKYPLDAISGGQHPIPPGSRFLALQVQGEVPVMWWAVPATSPGDAPLRTFSVVPTGPPVIAMEETANYLGTFQIDSSRSGMWVGHVFEREAIDS